MNIILSRPAIAYLHDIVMTALSFGLALYLRLGDGLIFYSTERMVQAGLLFTAICAIVFHVSGLYRGVWRYASIDDLWAITKAVSAAILIFSFVMFIMVRLETIPRSVPLINWFVLTALGMIAAEHESRHAFADVRRTRHRSRPVSVRRETLTTGG